MSIFLTYIHVRNPLLCLQHDHAPTQPSPQFRFFRHHFPPFSSLQHTALEWREMLLVCETIFHNVMQCIEPSLIQAVLQVTNSPMYIPMYVSLWEMLFAVLLSTFWQWDLVCERAYLKDLTQTILIVGVTLGCLICTTLSDKFGRKPVFLLSHWAMVVVGIANAFATNYYVFIVLRFLTGIFFLVGTPISFQLFISLCVDKHWEFRLAVFAQENKNTTVSKTAEVSYFSVNFKLYEGHVRTFQKIKSLPWWPEYLMYGNDNGTNTVRVAITRFGP